MTETATRHTPTDEQLACVDAVATGSSVMMDAYAGCAKTFTTVLAAQKVKVPALELVFNKRNAVEMTPKMPGNFKVQTMNGLGFGAWMRCQPQVNKWEVDARKLGKIVSQVAKDRKMELSSDQWEFARRLVEGAMLVGLVPGNEGSPLVLDSREVWNDIADGLLMTDDDFEFLYEIARESLRKSIVLSRQGMISFDDQVYCSCQPAGTLIAVKIPHSITQVPIEKIKPGDKVLSFDRKRGDFVGFHNHATNIDAVASRDYTGLLYKILVEDKLTCATVEHKWLVRWKPGAEEDNIWFTYLMEKEGSFKIGTTKIKRVWPTGRPCFGLSQRLYDEGGEKAWVLGVHYSLQAAKVEEAILVARFGITDCKFKEDGINSSGELHSLGKFVHQEQRTWNFLQERAVDCLKYFARDINFPFCSRYTARSFEVNFVLESCNLIEGLMELPLFENKEKPVWSTVRLGYEAVKNLKVYSLKVHRHELYIANGILTHNCLLGGKFPQYPFVGTDESQDLNALNHQMIALTLRSDGRLLVVGDPKQSIYGFRGAVTDSMEQMLGLRPSASWKRLPLATTFRCPKAIVARQQHHAPGFTAWHTNAEGKFLQLPLSGTSEIQVRASELEEMYWSFADLEDLKPQGGEMAILCRNNGPLMSLAFKLLREGVGVIMLGRDIGKGLIALSRKLCPEDATPRDTCAGLVADWSDSEQSLARANGQEQKCAGIADRAECLQAALANAGVSDAGGMRKALHALFARDNGRVTIGSIHRAKGMEWGLVAHLDPWRIPSRYAREASARGDHRQMEQEKNLLYVCETRTKDVLVNLNLEDFHS